MASSGAVETTSGAAIDQIKMLVTRLQESPDSRRHVVTAWNPADVEQMALPPCHCLFQFYVAPQRQIIPMGKAD